MKKRYVFSVLFLVCFVCASFPGSSLAATQQAPGFEEIAPAMEVRIAAAEESILAGVAAVELLLKSAKTESSEMTGAWNTILEQHFQSAAVKELRTMLSMLQMAIIRDAASGSGSKSPSAPVPLPYPNVPSTGEGNAVPARSAKGTQITLAIAKDIYNDAKELAEFAQEIVSAGEAVAWTLKVNRHMQSLRFDIKNAPVRVDVYVKEMRETSASLVNIIAKVKRGVELRKRANVPAPDLATLRNEVVQSIGNVILMRNKTVNAALSLVNTTKYLEPGEGYVIPETEAKRIAVLAEYWRDAKNLYPLVRGDIPEGVARWAPLPKAKWEAYGETRKKFVEVYGPLLAGNIFKGISLFEGKKYNELPGVVIEVENALRALLENIDDLKKNMEQRRKTLEQDEIITQRERFQLMALSSSYSPVAARNLVFAAARVGGGVNRILELERLKNGVAKNSNEYKKYEAEQKLLQSRKHPEQIKADTALKDFGKGLEAARKTTKDILDKHTARRKALGLPPALKEITLAKE